MSKFYVNKNGVWKNAVWPKVLFIVLVVLIAVEGCCVGIQQFSIHGYKRQLEQYRIELTDIEADKQRLAITIDRCRELLEQSDSSISSIDGSVQSIRNGLAEIQNYIKELEKLCNPDVNYNDGHNPD